MGPLLDLAKDNPLGLVLVAVAALASAVAGVVKLLTKRAGFASHTLADQRFVDKRIEHKLSAFEGRVNYKLRISEDKLRREFNAGLLEVTTMLREHVEGTAPLAREVGEIKVACGFLQDGLERVERAQEATQEQIRDAVLRLGDELRKLNG